jgi:hypothetical protein
MTKLNAARAGNGARRVALETRDAVPNCANRRAAFGATFDPM